MCFSKFSRPLHVRSENLARRFKTRGELGLKGKTVFVRIRSETNLILPNSPSCFVAFDAKNPTVEQNGERIENGGFP